MEKKKEILWFQKQVGGVTTVEMAYLMPILFLAFILAVYTAFYYHDKCILLGAASETAVLGAQVQRKPDETGQTDIEAFFQERISGKLIFFPGAQVQVSLSEKWVEVQVSAGQKGMQISVMQNASVVKPEKLIRMKRTAEDLAGETPSNETEEGIEE